jgi:hypothetical protein
MKLPAIIVALLLAIGLPAYFIFFSPSATLKRATNKSLQQFAQAVVSQDRGKVGASLRELLTDNAKIHLTVQLLSITQPVPPMAQEMNKEQFIGFLDNVLYTLTDYHYEVKLEEFVLADDRKTAAVKFSSKEWADGSGLYGANSVQMRFSGSTLCEGQAAFEGKLARLSQASCKEEYRAVPKPGEFNKVKEELKEQIKQFKTP